VALLVAGGSSAFAYWKSDSVALAMSHARPADPTTYARLHNLVEGLCIAAGLPKPRVYVIDDEAPNAFATGRNPRHAAIAVTTGLLDKMTRVELEGVLAHELSHVKNYDILVSTLAVTLVGVVALLADFSLRFMWWGGPRHRDDDSPGGGGAAAALAVVGLILLVVAPLVAKVMQATISRRREALADVSGVALTRYPPGLISALEKLKEDTTVVHSSSRATAHLWVESPLARTPEEGRLSRLNRLFDTHPPLEERIQALKEL
jgi:heat shock protein HtpX